MTESEIIAKARRIGARRERHDDEGKKIQEQVSEIFAVSKGIVTRERLADLLGMHRSSLYELFGGSDDDNGDRPAASNGAAKGQ